MEIHGREIGFRRSVGANCEIAEMCPGGDITKIDEVLTASDYTKSMSLAARIICSLNKWYELAQDEPGKPLTVDEVMSLDPDEFGALYTAALNAWTNDAKTTVEAEPVKGKNASGDGE